jgi:lantibiotic modifying enzyme
MPARGAGHQPARGASKTARREASFELVDARQMKADLPTGLIRPAWRPLVTGACAAKLRGVIGQIASALEETAGQIEEPSLCDGQAGVALFFAFLYELSRDDRHAAMAGRMVEAAFESLPEKSQSLGLLEGMAGVAWSVRRTLSGIGAAPPSDLTADLDAALMEALGPSPWKWEYDLTRGLVGLGCYALYHPDRDYSATVVELVLARLEELAIVEEAGMIWRTSPQLMAKTNARLFPDGGVDLGIAHGVAGVIAFLARLVSLPTLGHRAGLLLDGTLRWLLRHRRQSGAGSEFTYFVVPGTNGEGRSARSAWCYGDPGVAAALIAAAQETGDDDLRRRGIDVALRDCLRRREESGVEDAALCHGAAGLGHLYNRLFQMTRERSFAAAARRWFDCVVEMRQVGQGVGGYLSWWEGRAWRANPGYLNGAAGIGLALLAAISAAPPNWDQALLLAPPP